MDTNNMSYDRIVQTILVPFGSSGLLDIWAVTLPVGHSWTITVTITARSIWQKCPHHPMTLVSMLFLSPCFHLWLWREIDPTVLSILRPIECWCREKRPIDTNVYFDQSDQFVYILCWYFRKYDNMNIIRGNMDIIPKKDIMKKEKCYKKEDIL